MNESESFLAGKVRKCSLPVIEGIPPTDAPSLKRLLLPQGELAQVYDSEPGIRYIAFTELRADRVRGNHYHEVKEEFVYILAGKALLVVEDVESKARSSTELQTGDQVFIATRIAHALRPVCPGQAIEFSVARFNAADVHRYPLI
jgi:mannose-6-phosphate isomerase-like protein (cupin superfamily)